MDTSRATNALLRASISITGWFFEDAEEADRRSDHNFRQRKNPEQHGNPDEGSGNPHTTLFEKKQVIQCYLKVVKNWNVSKTFLKQFRDQRNLFRMYVTWNVSKRFLEQKQFNNCI